jgi:isopentenyl phosphate kinase
MDLVFLKLGGSLITDKRSPHTARPEVIARLAGEIARACQQSPGLQLVLGHGSGSFGHVPARQYGTRLGVHTPQGWLGFVEVWHAARALNQVVMQALAEAGLPALTLQPSASVIAADGTVLRWDLYPLQSALTAGLIPVVHGDVIFDERRGGTILSTEDLFDYLARYLLPTRLLLAGIEEGVWLDFPTCTHLVKTITPENFGEVEQALGGSAATDVTGGMASKVKASLDLVQAIPGLEVSIFSGERPGLVLEALLGSRPGSLICTSER